MALADFHSRSAAAAVQVLDGYDEQRLEAQLKSVRVGVSFDDATLAAPEGRALLDMAVRLLSRLYPSIELSGPRVGVRSLRNLAQAINPMIDFSDASDLGIVVGREATQFPSSIFAGSSGWDATLSTRRAQAVAKSNNPLGAGASACLAAAAVFRRAFSVPDRDDHLRFSTLVQDRVDRATRAPRARWRLRGESLLVGAGAIGNAAVWALARSPVEGTLHVIDPEEVDLGNLQRYVLTEHADVGRRKTELAAAQSSSALDLLPHHCDLGGFLELKGHSWPYMLLGLDSARDRVAAQASLPRWIANAWTQPGDLGSSVHPHFGGQGACVACLYLPAGELPNEDQLVADTLGVPGLLMQVRTLLHTGAPVDRSLLDAVSAALQLPLERLTPFEGRPIRELYVEGFCGGGVIPISEAGRPREEIHVPLAHQSALAGVLLGASLVRNAIGIGPDTTTTSQLDVLSPLGDAMAHPVSAARDGRCICDDPDFVDAYKRKYESG